MAKNLDFSYKNLNELFRIISHYDTISVRNFYSKKENCIVMRHDVDFSLKRAMEFAKIESNYNINATYFIMTTSPMYNIHTLDNIKRIRQIVDMGFEVGLHFDQSIYYDNFEKYLEKEVSDLSFVSCYNISSYSLHNPSLLSYKFHSNKFIDAWSEEIFEGYYSADSRMLYPKNIRDMIKLSKIRPVQIALHPEHYTEEGFGYGKIFTNIVLDFCLDMDNTFSVNSEYLRKVKSMYDKMKIHTVRAVL